MISIIVPVFNVEMYIARCIQSIMAQSYDDFELIIIDDGSEDLTGAICLKYAEKDNRIIYIRKRNEGQGIARNLGLRIAKGEYVTYVDGDDWLENNTLEEMHRLAEQERVDIVVGDIWYVYENEENETERIYSKIRYNHLQIIKQGEHPEKISKLRTFTCGKLYRRNFLLEEKFYQPAHAYEDTATIPLLLMHARAILYVNIPVYNYLKDRITSTIYNRGLANDLLKSLQHLYAMVSKDSFWEENSLEVKRLFWGQIRSLCKIHSVSPAEIRDRLSDYGKLLTFMKETFTDFDMLEEYEICVFNSKIVEKALKNLAIHDSGIKGETDFSDARCRIVMKKGQEVRNIHIDDKYRNIEAFDENQLWDCTDELFGIVMKRK